MADMTREQQRAEIHRTIWAIADKVRNSVDAWDFKQYVLGMLFYRYISEDFAYYIDVDEIASGDTGFSYAALSDEDAEMDPEEVEDLVREKGCFIKPSQLFCNVWKSARKAADEGRLAESDLNTTLSNTLSAIEQSSVGFPSPRRTSAACSTTSTPAPSAWATRLPCATSACCSSWTASAAWTSATSARTASTRSATPTSSS